MEQVTRKARPVCFECDCGGTAFRVVDSRAAREHPPAFSYLFERAASLLGDVDVRVRVHVCQACGSSLDTVELAVSDLARILRGG